jgi:hypothetical protein
MKLFYFNPNNFSPLLIIVAKLDSNDKVEKLEAYTHEIFQILMDENEANESSIIIFSIIKDHEKSTMNMILPCVKSNMDYVKKCEEDVSLVNKIIVQTLMKNNTKFYFEILENKILIHMKEINLGELKQFYLF